MILKVFPYYSLKFALVLLIILEQFKKYFNRETLYRKNQKKKEIFQQTTFVRKLMRSNSKQRAKIVWISDLKAILL